MTTGAPKAEVTVPIASSVGENAVLAIRSQNTQNTAPHRQEAGMTSAGRLVFSRERTIWGTAIPTKEMGPAKAVTQAESRLERIISRARKSLTLMPRLRA